MNDDIETAREIMENIRRKKLFEEGATFVSQWTTIIGFVAVVLLGYAVEFEWVTVSHTKAFFLGVGVMWLVMMLVHIYGATSMPSLFFKDRNG